MAQAQGANEIPWFGGTQGSVGRSEGEHVLHLSAIFGHQLCDG